MDRVGMVLSSDNVGRWRPPPPTPFPQRCFPIGDDPRPARPTRMPRLTHMLLAHLRLDIGPVLRFAERHPPDGVASRLRTGLESLSQILIRRPHTRVLIAESDHACTGERGHVHDSIHLELFGEYESVGKGQATLSIRVDHLRLRLGGKVTVKVGPAWGSELR